MKKILYILVTISFLIGCNKENLNEDLEDNTDVIDQKQDLYESNLVFINSDWTFDTTGNSLKNQIIGLWLSNTVSYADTICNDCDSLFTWAIESTGEMIKRNNSWGENDTGNWVIDSIKNIILYSYKEYLTFNNGVKSGYYQIRTDSIKIEELSESNLWVSQYTGKTKMDIKFNKLK